MRLNFGLHKPHNTGPWLCYLHRQRRNKVWIMRCSQGETAVGALCNLILGRRGWRATPPWRAPD